MYPEKSEEKKKRVRGICSRNNYIYIQKRKLRYSLIREQREARDQYGCLVIKEESNTPVPEEQQREVQQPTPEQPTPQYPANQQAPWTSQEVSESTQQRWSSWKRPHSRRMDELVDQVIMLRQKLDVKEQLIAGLQQQLTSEQQRTQQCQQLIDQQQRFIQHLQNKN